METFLFHFGVAVGAITGVLAARGKKVDLFGVVVLAIVAALGGGTVRDVVMGNLPVFWVQDSWYLVNAVLTAVVVFYLVRFRELPSAALMVSDAFALALFTMVGARAVLPTGEMPAAAVAVAMGVTTGVAGGILRDLLVGQMPLVFRREIYLYATAAFLGASLFVMMRDWNVEPKSAMIIGTLSTLLLRLIGMKWRITLPMFRPQTQPTDDAQ